jgi:hypothetical protein
MPAVRISRGAYNAARNKKPFVGAFANLRKSVISFTISVRLSIGSAWTNSGLTGRILMKFDI